MQIKYSFKFYQQSKNQVDALRLALNDPKFRPEPLSVINVSHIHCVFGMEPRFTCTSARVIVNRGERKHLEDARPGNECPDTLVYALRRHCSCRRKCTRGPEQEKAGETRVCQIKDQQNEN